MAALGQRARPAANERAQDPEAAREAALKMLERSRRTRSELIKKLRERGFEASTIEGVIERLAAVSLIDDVEYARAFLANRLGRRTAGWRRLELELRRRGVKPQDAATARARLGEEGSADEATLARRLLDQVAARYQKVEPRVRRQRLYALLARRGFDSDVIERVLREES